MEKPSNGGGGGGPKWEGEKEKKNMTPHIDWYNWAHKNRGQPGTLEGWKGATVWFGGVTGGVRNKVLLDYIQNSGNHGSH